MFHILIAGFIFLLPTNTTTAADLHPTVHPHAAVVKQVIKSFDNPEGAIFSANGNYVFI